MQFIWPVVVIPECNERPIHDCCHRIRRSAWPVAQYDDASAADREQAHERMLERERQEHHAQTLDYAAQVHDSGGRGIR